MIYGCNFMKSILCTGERDTSIIKLWGKFGIILLFNKRKLISKKQLIIKQKAENGLFIQHMMTMWIIYNMHSVLPIFPVFMIFLFSIKQF